MDPANETINAAVEQLNRIADEQRLIEEARAPLRRAWVPEDLGDLAFGYENVEARFSSCKLVFKSGTLTKKYPFVQTTLDLNVGRHHVGYYMLITLPSGEAEDDYLVIYDEFAEGGRLVEDVREEVIRQRDKRNQE